MISNNPEYVSTPNGSLIRYHVDGTQEIIKLDIPSDKNDPDRKNMYYIFNEDISR